ncbi:hypothetical protein [Kitasatospora phosalacinea]|nr:hypothetical protein [Kitasatospora phosalacinea]
MLLLVLVTLLVGAGVAAVLHHSPAWAVPVAGAIATMTLVATIIGLLIAVAHS